MLVFHRVAVFVDGCFWHSCPEHGRAQFNDPNAALWDAKMRRNKERDVRADELARASGYAVLRLWECQVIASPAQAAQMVQNLLVVRLPPPPGLAS